MTDGPGVYDVLEARATAEPDSTALRWDGREWTFAELALAAARWAAYLAERGVRSGDRVALFANAPPESVLVLFAAARLGAVFVPIPPDAAAREVAEVLDRVRPRLLLVSTDTAHRAGEVASAALVHPVVLPGAIVPLPAEVPRPSGADPIVVWFTSGTTGAPKGAPWDHTGFLVNAVEKWSSRLDFEPVETVLKAGTMAHSAMAVSCIGPILRGHTVELLTGTSPAAIASALVDRRISVVAMAPTVAHLVLDELAQQQATSLPALRRVVVGGGPVPVALLDRLVGIAPGARVYNGYGASEGLISCHDVSADPTRPDSVGRPFDGVEVELRDTEGQAVPDGATGTVWARGAGIISSYWGAEPGPGGWVSTGDLARRDPDGYLTVEGRTAEIIVSGGFNVSGPEVEAVLATHPSVAEVAVVGAPDAVLGEKVVAFVVGTAASVDTDALAAHCAAGLARFKRPRAFVVVDALPKGPLGKVRRGDLVAPERP